MRRLFGSFLVRWWQVDDLHRFELEHIQSGRRGLVSSLDEAMTWKTACADDLQTPTADGGTEPSVALEGSEQGGGLGKTRS